VNAVDLNRLIKEPRYEAAILRAVETDNHLRIARFYLLSAGSAAVAVAAFAVFIWSSDPSAREWAKSTLTIVVSAAFGVGLGSQKGLSAQA
jgi:hypothetical protein